MGQRHQYIIGFPKKYHNANNPNNRDAIVETIHHQWLFGYSAVFALARVLRLAHNSAEVRSDGSIDDIHFGRDTNGYAHNGTEAIGAAISVDPENGYYHNVHLNEFKGPGKDLIGNEHLDNNNGCTVVQFQKGELLPRVCFVTPYHVEGSHWNDDHDGIAKHLGPWTPQQYLALHYSQAEQDETAKADPAYAERLAKAYEDIAKFSRPMTRAQFLKMVPNFWSKPSK